MMKSIFQPLITNVNNLAICIIVMNTSYIMPILQIIFNRIEPASVAFTVLDKGQTAENYITYKVLVIC